ncbi:MAG: aminodeoxychorismate/anthranilate synthase component II [Flavobacteriaceae bacterium]|nr:MAG: aminodeoxychorismate/anthranilate synthase component II [Flavobacteriaceae bacterium]
MKILVIDNYDSFTYNLVHSIKKFHKEIEVFRNDQISLEQVEAYDKILLSPGPGVPDQANMLKPIIEKYGPTKSIFGVCLGQQAICEVYGGSLLNTKEVYHGVASLVEVDLDEVLFKGLESKIEVGRYHSWVVNPDDFPSVLKVTATGPKGEIMALAHQSHDVRAVQFHPESVLTPMGDKIIENWLNHNPKP